MHDRAKWLDAFCSSSHVFTLQVKSVQCCSTQGDFKWILAGCSKGVGSAETCWPRFGTSGPSGRRIEGLISKESCRCHRGSCYSQLTSVKSTLLEFLRVFWSFKSTFKMSIWDKFLAREKKGSFLGKEWDPSVWSQRLVLAAAALLELAKGGLTAATRFGGLHLGLGLASLTSVLKSWHCCLQNDTSIVTSLVELIWPQHGKIW